MGTNRIEKALLNGSQRVPIVTANLVWPSDIELDKENKRIFWVDTWYERVESADYNGNNRKHIFYQNGLQSFGVALISPFLFLTRRNTRKVDKVDANTGHWLGDYRINGGKPMGIVAYDYARQPKGI